MMRVMIFIYDDDESDDDDVLCACIRVVHFRGNLALIRGLCDECILVILVDFNSMRPCRV
jgi:hypothetical protein